MMRFDINSIVVDNHLKDMFAGDDSHPFLDAVVQYRHVTHGWWGVGIIVANRNQKKNCQYVLPNVFIHNFLGN